VSGERSVDGKPRCFIVANLPYHYDVRVLAQNLAKVAQKEKYKEPYNVYHSEGCKECKGKAFMGRVALYEGFKMTRELEEIVNEKATEGNISDEATRQGMVTLRQDGIFKALDGLITIEDVLRETSES